MFSLSTVVLLLVFVDTAYPIAFPIFRPYKGKYEWPAIVKNFVGSLSAQEKAALKAAYESDSSSTKATGLKKLLDGLSASKKVPR